MSKRAQVIMIWWSLAFTTIYGLSFWLLLHMVPPPSATWSAQQVANWYSGHSTDIRVGAVIASWTSAFMVPLSVVIAVQMSRLEKGRPAWSILTVASGSLMSIFLVLPPLFWGIAAFTPTRAAEITATMHELGMLTLVTTDQYFVFMWVAMVIISFRKTMVAHSPFPRWFGYYTGWNALMFEAGAIAFLPRTGPFAWNGLLVFWAPFCLFFSWLVVVCVLLLRSIKQQEADELAPALVVTSAPQATPASA